MAKKEKQLAIPDPVKTRVAFVALKHASGNVSIAQVNIPEDLELEEVVRPCHPLVACDSLFDLAWREVWVKSK